MTGFAARHPRSSSWRKRLAIFALPLALAVPVGAESWDVEVASQTGIWEGGPINPAQYSEALKEIFYRLGRRGYPVHVLLDRNGPESTVRHLIRIGPYETAREARRSLDALRAEYPSSALTPHDGEALYRPYFVERGEGGRILARIQTFEKNYQAVGLNGVFVVSMALDWDTPPLPARSWVSVPGDRFPRRIQGGWYPVADSMSRAIYIGQVTPQDWDLLRTTRRRDRVLRIDPLTGTESVIPRLEGVPIGMADGLLVVSSRPPTNDRPRPGADFWAYDARRGRTSPLSPDDTRIEEAMGQARATRRIVTGISGETLPLAVDANGRGFYLRGPILFHQAFR